MDNVTNSQALSLLEQYTNEEAPNDPEQEIKRLRMELELEQGQVNILRQENQDLRQKTVDLQRLAEEEEEYISNQLLKRIEKLKREKGELLVQVEQEEEYLSTILQHRLEKRPAYSKYETAEQMRSRIQDLEKELAAQYSQALMYKKELVELRTKAGLPVADLMGDDEPPSIMRGIFPAVRSRSSSLSSLAMRSRTSSHSEK